MLKAMLCLTFYDFFSSLSERLGCFRVGFLFPFLPLLVCPDITALVDWAESPIYLLNYPLLAVGVGVENEMSTALL